jgi:CRP-like cAMP-binding protein
MRAGLAAPGADAGRERRVGIVTPRRRLTACVAPTSDSRRLTTMIDRIRHDIQERLEELLAEIDRLRHALAALDPRARPTGASAPAPAKASRAPAKASPAKAKTSPAKASPPKPASAAQTTPRAAPGQTRATVIAALSSDAPLTAADVAAATGLARPTVSTTLSRLVKSGAVTKADRGYLLPAGDGGTSQSPEVDAS